MIQFDSVQFGAVRYQPKDLVRCSRADPCRNYPRNNTKEITQRFKQSICGGYLHHLCDEQRQADAEGRHEGAAVFLDSEHEDSEDELGREEDLDEEPLHDRGV